MCRSTVSLVIPGTSAAIRSLLPSSNFKGTLQYQSFYNCEILHASSLVSSPVLHFVRQPRGSGIFVHWTSANRNMLCYFSQLRDQALLARYKESSTTIDFPAGCTSVYHFSYLSMCPCALTVCVHVYKHVETFSCQICFRWLLHFCCLFTIYLSSKAKVSLFWFFTCRFFFPQLIAC